MLPRNADRRATVTGLARIFKPRAPCRMRDHGGQIRALVRSIMYQAAGRRWHAATIPAVLSGFRTDVSGRRLALRRGRCGQPGSGVQAAAIAISIEGGDGTVRCMTWTPNPTTIWWRGGQRSAASVAGQLRWFLCSSRATRRVSCSTTTRRNGGRSSQDQGAPATTGPWIRAVGQQFRRTGRWPRGTAGRAVETVLRPRYD